MTTTWEYLRVSRIYEIRTASDESGSSFIEATIRVYRLGQEVEVVPEGTTMLRTLEALGQEGWELVSETVWDTGLLPSRRGWPEIGTPVQVVMTFKRPRPAEA